MRKFETGATRNMDTNKFDYEGFFSPLVLKRRAQFMHEHRLQADGKLRDSDNWQRGIPFPEYIKSGWRHFMEWWLLHRGHKAFDEKGNSVDMENALTALLFNVEGYLHEYLKAKEQKQNEEINKNLS